MIKIFLALSLLSGGDDWLNPWGGMEQSPASGVVTTSAGVTCFYDLDKSVSLCVNTNDTTGLSIYGKNRTDDANALPMVVKTEAVSPFAAAAKVGGPAYVLGNIDSKTIIFDQANPDGFAACTTPATIRIRVNQTDTTLTYGVSFCVGGTCGTKALACASLASAIDSLDGVGATCVSEVVGITVDPSTGYFGLQETQPTCTTTSVGNLYSTVVSGLCIQNLGGTATNNTFSLGGTCGTTSGVADVFVGAAGFDAGTRIRSSAATNPESSVNYTSAADGTGGFWRVAAKGAKANNTTKVATITFAGGGGAASVTSAAAIPAKSSGVKVTCRVIVAGATCTGFDIGSAIGMNEYGSNIAVALGTTSVSDDTFDSYPVAGDIVLTPVGAATCSNLSARCTFFSDQVTADTTL